MDIIKPSEKLGLEEAQKDLDMQRERLCKHYPNKHLFGNVYLIRNYPRHYKRLTTWVLCWFKLNKKESEVNEKK